MQLMLNRDLRTTDFSVGVLEIAGKKFHTMERPWIPDPLGGIAGKKYESCIPYGTYRVEHWDSVKFGKVFILSNPLLGVYRLPSDVPKGQEATTRTLCLIHAGNYVHDVIGCVAVGKGRLKSGKAWMIVNSREALNEVRTLVGTRIDVTLTITGGN